MNMSTRILIVAFLALVANATQSQAQVRDAGSKILGNYDHFDQAAPTRRAPTSYVPQANAAQQPSNRAFSYDPAAPRAAIQPNRTTTQATPPQAARRFSYDPGYSAPRRSYLQSRGWQSGVRDAGSKVRGEY